MTKSTRRGKTAPAWLSSTALALVASLALASCAPAAEPAPEPLPSRAPIELKLGVLIPVTGTLSSAAPAMRAGIETALADVNDSGAGVTITAEYRDAADSTSATGLASATELIDLGVDAIVGPLSDGVARKVIDPIVDAGIVQISPGNRSPDFARADDNDLYWRTAASCALEGDALGARAAADGHTSLGVVHQSDFCGQEVAAAASIAFERGGGKSVVQSVFGPAGGTVDASIAEVSAAKPDAIVLLTAQSKDAVNSLVATGYTGEQLYLSGLGAADLSGEFAAGTLTGATTSALGPNITADFADRLTKADETLTDFSYSAESYDAVVLLALAALAGGDQSGESIAAQLRTVSGGTSGGKACESFNACADLVLAGEQADYDGLSGAISFDKAGDAAAASVRLFVFNSKNVAELVDR